MTLGWLHDRMPRSLYGRAALILLLPIATLVAGVSYAVVQRHYEDVTRQMTRSLALELRVVAAAAEAVPEVGAASDVGAALAAARAAGAPLEIEVALADEVPDGDRIAPWDLAGRVMARTMREEVPRLLAVAADEPRRVTLWIGTPGGPVEVSLARRRVAASNPHQLLVVTGLLGVLMTAVATLFLRNQLRPVRRLAEAATAYGRGRVVPFRAAGALEVRAAGTAFLHMRARIERQAQARTAMLAGVSHDLRTPLTRLKLGLSMMDDPEAEGLLRDVDDMGRMVDAFLAFARAEATDEPEPVALRALVAAVVSDLARGGRAVGLAPVEGEDPGPVPLRPLAVRRAIENLVNNALAHGSRARVALAFGERSVRVSVEDDGPGIPPERREEALRPFVRLDAARGQDRAGAGVGLGLAIVADVARAHGGSLRLGRSAALGGLRADLVLAL